MDASLDPVAPAAGEEARPGTSGSAGAASSARWTLVMAVHTLEMATSKVPFSMILLLDHIRTKRAISDEVARCRMVLPSDGLVSVSLWDTTDAAALKQWLDENLGSDCINTLSEVQEEFTWGVALELARARGADKVGERAAGARAALSASLSTAQTKLQAWDERTGAITMARETTATTVAKISGAVHKTAVSAAITMARGTTATTVAKISGAVHKAAENERVQTAAAAASAAVATGWRKATDMLGWARSRVDTAASGSGSNSPARYHSGDAPPQYGGGSARQYGAAAAAGAGASNGGAAAAKPDLDFDKQLRLSDDPLEGLDAFTLSAAAPATAPPAAAPTAAQAAAAAAPGAPAAAAAAPAAPAPVGGGFGAAHQQQQ